MYYDALPLTVKSADTIILLDGGYFVFRMMKHWSKTGRMRKAHNKMRSGKINWFQRQAAFQKAIEADVAYVNWRLGEMRKNPLYESSCYLIVCWDGIYGRRARGELDAQYKANRNLKQAEYNAAEHEGIDVREKLTKMGLEPNELSKRWFGIYDEDMEGDDLVAHLAIECLEQEKEVIVLSPDSDMVQLLKYPLTLHDLTSQVTDEAAYAKYGIYPLQYADWKALVGDTSDNIRGVPYIGKKKASKLLQSCEKIEDIPQENFLTFTPKYDLSRRLKEWRKEEGMSLAFAKRKYGSAWPHLEEGKIKEFSYDSVHKIVEVIGVNHFEATDYLNTALVSRKMIEIPFK